jgi:hypothetical protein
MTSVGMVSTFEHTMLVWYQLLNVPAWSLYLVHFNNFRPAWSWYRVLFKTFIPAWSWYWWEYGQGWSQPGPGIGSFLELSYQLGPGIGMDTDKACITWSWCWVLSKTSIPTWSWCWVLSKNFHTNLVLVLGPF